MLGRFVKVYCDDILNFSKTREDHLVHVRMVFQTLRRLRHHKLFVKASKCQFSRPPVGFLGHVISERGVVIDPKKVVAVAQWAQPTSCTDNRRFIGQAIYYCKFVQNFSCLAAPLTALCSPQPPALGSRGARHWQPVAGQQSFASGSGPQVRVLAGAAGGKTFSSRRAPLASAWLHVKAEHQAPPRWASEHPLPDPRPHAAGRVHQPRLFGAAGLPLRSRLPAGPHRVIYLLTGPGRV